MEQTPGFKIINAGMCLLSEDRDYSPVEAEALALDRVITSCYHWLYYCNDGEIFGWHKQQEFKENIRKSS